MGELIPPESQNNSEDEKYRQSTIDHLKSLRFDYSDEIPEQIIRGDAEVKNFKVRKNWWQGLFGDLHLTTQLKMVGPDLEAKIEAFVQKYGNIEFNERLTTAEDIAEANTLINAILAEVGNTP